jgi:hypothetical protein
MLLAMISMHTYWMAVSTGDVTYSYTLFLSTLLYSTKKLLYSVRYSRMIFGRLPWHVIKALKLH